MADPAFEDGKFLTIMSTAPAAVPKMAVQASFSSGRTSFLKLDGLSATPNLVQHGLHVVVMLTQDLQPGGDLVSTRCHGGLAG